MVTREDLVATFEANWEMLADGEVWTDYVQPFGRPFGPNVMTVNHNLGVDDEFHAVFWRVLFALDAGYQLVADPGRTEVTAERRGGPASPGGKAWSEWSTGVYNPAFGRGGLTLRDAEPLPSWLVPGGGDGDRTVTIDLRAVVGWLMRLIGDGRLAGVMARFWAEIADEQTTGPLCTLHDAKWCPNCGYCTCDRSAAEFGPSGSGEHYDVEYESLGKPGCPLHDETVSRHRHRQQPATGTAAS